MDGGAAIVYSVKIQSSRSQIKRDTYEIENFSGIEDGNVLHIVPFSIR